ncbi:MAG: hypothetical protein ACKVQA_06910 [Burkholderiales bacterium]
MPYDLTPLYLVGALIAWSWVCVHAGAIWEGRRQQREDLDERDAWAERYQDEHKGAA